MLTVNVLKWIRKWQTRGATSEDQTDIAGARALIVEARFYDDIQDALLEGALAELKPAGVLHDIVTVPGALEIPAAIAITLDAAEKIGNPTMPRSRSAASSAATPSIFEIVSIESSRALMDFAVARKFPLGNGIITVNTEAQAWARARPASSTRAAMPRVRRSPCCA